MIRRCLSALALVSGLLQVPVASSTATHGAANQPASRQEPSDVFRLAVDAVLLNVTVVNTEHRYVTDVEGYPGLVVHGPLLATLLLDLLHCNVPDATVARFAFRAMKPTFDTAPFHVCGRRDGTSIHLWAKHVDGALAMDATATLA